MRRIFLMAVFLYAIAAASAQPTGNTLIQPDCLVPFTLTAAGNYPTANVTNAQNDNRTRDCAAWTLMYQNTGMTAVTVTLQSGCSTSTTVTYGTFAGIIPTTPASNTNPIVSDTGGSLQAANGIACISWVRVNVAATGTGTLTGVLYGYRITAVAGGGGGGGGGGNCPQGAAGDVQYYVSAGVCGGSNSFIWDNVDALAKIGGAPVAPFAGLYVGPDESTLNASIQGYTGGQTLLTTIGGTGVGIEAQEVVSGVGVVGLYAVTLNSVDANYSRAIQGDALTSFAGGSATALTGFVRADGAAVASLWGLQIDTPVVTNGATAISGYGLWVADQTVSGITNSYYSWFDSQGVRRVKEDNTFNAVGQAIEALYNPQFTKYTPGAANFERITLGQWESNIAVIATEAGGTGTLRPLRFDAASVSTGVTFQAGGYLSSDASVGTTGNGFKNGLCVTASGACPGGAAFPAGTTSADEQCWASATTFGVCANTTISGRATEGSATLTADVVNPFINAKNSQTATAPGAGKADLRWLAGTNMGTCKLVANAGTSATEVTIIDNVGGGC